jgi:Tfp pilus assembly protein PilF
VNVAAHEAYLKGRFHWNRRTEEGIHQAIDFFTRALAIDPAYAPAYAGLAQALVVESDYGSGAPRELIPKAKAAARRALELDPDSSEAHAALALSTANLDLDWAGAESEFVRALDVNPNDATAHHWYALLLGAQGRMDAATKSLRHAQEIDPLSLIITTELGWLYHVQGLDDDAREQFRKAFEIDRDYWFAQMLAGRVYELHGEAALARAAFERGVAGSAHHPLALAALGHFVAASDRAAARRILTELDTMSARRFVSGYHRAAIHIGLGEHDNAVRALRDMYEQRGGFWLMWLRSDPWFQVLHDRADFKALIREMHLPPL